MPPAAARDHDDHLTRWLGGLHAPFLVVRPDKFVVAQFSADGATAATRDAIALLGTD